MGTVHRRSSVAAPRHQQRLRQSQRQTHHQEDLHISPIERSTILHQRRSQLRVTSPRRFTAFNNLKRRRHSSSLSSVPNLLTISAISRTPATTPPSTVPSPSTTTMDQQAPVQQRHQTPLPLPSHRRAQAESQSPASCAVADSSDNRSQKLGKQENRSCKHN
jgi:hypothetical protein